MRRWLALLPLVLCACKPPEDSHAKVIIGAVLIDGNGGPPVSNSVVVVAGSDIREVGVSSAVAIPEEAGKVDGSGRFLIPGFVDVCPRPQNSEKSNGPVVYIGKGRPDEVQAALEKARESGRIAIGFASTQEETQLLVNGGASAIVGMIADTEDLPPSLVAQLRDLRIVVAPSLYRLEGRELKVALRNTRNLFAAGVPIAVASQGGDFLKEAEALADAGVPPLDVIVAATRNGALALHEGDRRGTVQAGKQADLILLSANPGEDVRNLGHVAGRFTAGIWSQN